MTIGCLRCGSAVVLLAFTAPTLACTEGESEDKVREAIYAVSDLQQRDAVKAKFLQQRIDRALDEALEPAASAQAQQARTDQLCKAMDEILAELRR